MDRPHLVPAENSKVIAIPSMGLYNSYLDCQLDSDIESYCNGNDAVETEVNDFIYSLDLRPYSDALAAGYCDMVAGLLNEQYGLKLTATGAYYEGLNGQNVGDNFVCELGGVDTMPDFETLAAAVGLSADDLISAFKQKARDNFTSYDGFISFYDPDISPLLDAPFSRWASPYFEAFIAVLCAHLDDITGAYELEQLYIERLDQQGGALELLFSVLSDTDTDTDSDKLNAILAKLDN